MHCKQFCNHFRNLKIKYFWIFVTTKCNLRCDYCFYRRDVTAATISLSSVKHLLKSFPLLNSSEFVLSGGEPILEWKITSEIIRHLSSRQKKYILLQTNGTLLDKNKIRFLKDYGVGLEFGIDGDLAAMKDHRKGIQRYFPKLIENIRMAQHQNMDVLATMTVHPKMASRTFKNFKYLFNLGIKKIEITPAAFQKWRDDDILVFKKDYKKIVSFTLTKRRPETINTEYDKLLPYPMVDFIYLPDKSIVTNWALLSLPQSLKTRYTMFKTTRGKIKLNEYFASSFFRQYLKFFNDHKNPTYRDFSNLNAKWVYKELSGERSGNTFENYNNLGSFLKTINQKVVSFKTRMLP